MVLEPSQNLKKLESVPPKFIVFRGVILELNRDSIGLWRFEDGTIAAGIRDDTVPVDSIDRCGVGILSLPVRHPLTAACKVHDFFYESWAYQVFHTRLEADEYLSKLVKRYKNWGWLSTPFEKLAQWFGARLWENELTR